MVFEVWTMLWDDQDKWENPAKELEWCKVKIQLVKKDRIEW